MSANHVVPRPPAALLLKSNKESATGQASTEYGYIIHFAEPSENSVAHPTDGGLPLRAGAYTSLGMGLDVDSGGPMKLGPEREYIAPVFEYFLESDTVTLGTSDDQLFIGVDDGSMDSLSADITVEDARALHDALGKWLEQKGDTHA